MPQHGADATCEVRGSSVWFDRRILTWLSTSIRSLRQTTTLVVV